MLKSTVLTLALLGMCVPDVAAQADAKKAKQPAEVAPAHDPVDIPFRRAPMGLASRSIVVSLATNVHLAWDAKLLRTHTVWEGESLNLYGPPFNGTATRFICDVEGSRRLWGDRFTMPWFFLETNINASPQGRFVALSTRGRTTTFIYDAFSSPDAPVLVHESPRIEEVQGLRVIVRKFEVAKSAVRATVLVHHEHGDSVEWPVLPASALIKRPTDLLLVTARGSGMTKFGKGWGRGEVAVKLHSEKDGKGPYSAVVTNTHADPRTAPIVEINSSEGDVSFEIATVLCRDIAQASRIAPMLARVPVSPARMGSLFEPIDVTNESPPLRLKGDGFFVDKPAGDDFFRVEHFPVPKEIKLMVGGMDFLPNGDLAVCTLAGEVWIVEGATNAPQRAVWRRFARGLNEPAGLKVVNGRIIVVQKCELTRLVDTDGNGEADLFECLSDDWGYNGNYHSFAFGPALDAAGNFYVMLTGHRTIYDLPRMGWGLRVSRDVVAESKVQGPRSKVQSRAGDWVPLEGRFKTEPFCSGLRCPNGFGAYQGDIFITDNQGHWVAANKLVHLQAGKFYGHPSATPAPREKFDGDANFAPPAVWFPYAWVRSASGITTITDERFGPFKGQMLVGEFQNASVVRVALEKVGGEWQGAVFPFTKGFYSGVNRLAFGPDGKLYVGGLRMGHWTSIAPQPHSLDRVSFTGRVPFEIREVHAKPDGFELTFTQPVDAVSADDLENWDAAQYTYGYDGKHFAPEKDRDEKVPGPEVRVTRATVSADRLTVRLKVEGCRERHVIMVRALSVKNAEGKPLRNDTFHYTLNRMPGN